MGQIVESIRSGWGTVIFEKNYGTLQFRPRKNCHVLHATIKLGKNLTEEPIG